MGCQEIIHHAVSMADEEPEEVINLSNPHLPSTPPALHTIFIHTYTTTNVPYTTSYPISSLLRVDRHLYTFPLFTFWDLDYHRTTPPSVQKQLYRTLAYIRFLVCSLSIRNTGLFITNYYVFWICYLLTGYYYSFCLLTLSLFSFLLRVDVFRAFSVPFAFQDLSLTFLTYNHTRIYVLLNLIQDALHIFVSSSCPPRHIPYHPK